MSEALGTSEAPLLQLGDLLTRSRDANTEVPPASPWNTTSLLSYADIAAGRVGC